MLNDQDLEVRKMTVGELFDMLDNNEDIDDDSWERMKKVLALILWAAKNGIDKDMARDMARALQPKYCSYLTDKRDGASRCLATPAVTS